MHAQLLETLAPADVHGPEEGYRELGEGVGQGLRGDLGGLPRRGAEGGDLGDKGVGADADGRREAELLGDGSAQRAR